jgi:hypothetical protein
LNFFILIVQSFFKSEVTPSARVSTDIVAQAVKFADILSEEEFVPDYDELSDDDDLPKRWETGCTSEGLTLLLSGKIWTSPLRSYENEVTDVLSVISLVLRLVMVSMLV